MGRFEMSNWLAGPRAADSSLRAGVCSADASMGGLRRD